MLLRYVVYLSFLISFSALAAIPPKPVLGFSDWKNQKIKAAYVAYQATQKNYIEFRGTVFERNNKYKEATRQYRVLQATRKLTIHDYFQMYLMSEHPDDVSAMKNAIASLNQQQVAELMLAYQKSLRGKPQKLYIQRSR